MILHVAAFPPQTAVMSAVPLPTALTMPLFTVATDVLLDVHATGSFASVTGNILGLIVFVVLMSIVAEEGLR